MHKAIFHIDEMSKAELTIKNIRAALETLGQENILIELLANSEGVRLFIASDNEYSAFLTDFAEKGVIFAGCARSIHGLGINNESLLEFTEIVPSGVVELIEKQANGYAYIKP